MKRKISATMSTQHPDHASVPYWHDNEFISTNLESKETYLSFSELGIYEYKWDWEGKLVDESVLERLFGEYFEFFKKNPLGQQTYLTFRLPNPKVETEFRIGRAFMNLASAASVAKHFGLPTPPLFEVILPMTADAESIIEIQTAYQDIHSLKHPLYRLEKILTNPRVIPLFEDVETIINSDKIIEKYVGLYEKEFKKKPARIRPYVARSDPALNFGMIPTVIAIKIALSRYRILSKKLKIPFYPIIGAAVLPFRGGIDPLHIKKFVDEYKGIRTTTIQSAFRYDFDKKDVIEAVKYLEDTLPTLKADIIPEKDENIMIDLIPFFEKNYRETIEKIAPLINKVASFLPRRRERVQHIGLFGYSRGVGKVKLPRAIGFTAALYSIGVPPEFIGTGRGLKNAKNLGQLDTVKKYYKYLAEDMDQAGRFLNRENLEILSKKSPVWKKITEDIKDVEDTLGIKLGPVTKEEHDHQKLTTQIYKKIESGESPTELIVKSALIRKSLG
ncbi:MAG TPA: phosphoenolpyruvate carboxylase [Candidatus Limnocylindrales bacterium]|nr:phosphoenolpyruvate carboxylase [Candidatus Limnocylindrales bacterium]